MKTWPEIQEEGIARAAGVLEARPDAETLRQFVITWIEATREVSAADISQVAVHPATDALADQLERANLREVADHLRSLAETTGSIHPGIWAFSALLGKASATDLVTGLAKGEWRPARFWNHDCFGAWQAYSNEIVALLRADNALEAAAWTYIDKEIDEICQDPNQCISHKQDRDAGSGKLLADYARSPDIEEAWDSQLDGKVELGNAFFLELMQEVDPVRFLERVAKLPHPAIAQQCIPDFKSISDTDLAKLIENAAPSCDPGGLFTHQGMITILLLRVAEKRIRYRAWKGERAPPPVSDSATLRPEIDATQSSITAVLDALFMRNDSDFLVWTWLERLIFEGEVFSVWRTDFHQATGFVVDPLLALIQQLAQRLTPKSDFAAWALAGMPPHRVYRISAILAVQVWGAGTDNQGRKESLRWSMVGIDVSFGVAIESVGRPRSVVGAIGGACLSATDDPASLIQELWQDIRPKRERVWHRDSDTQAAELLILWSFSALEFAIGQRKQATQYVLEDILRDAYQTDAIAGNIAFWPKAFHRFFHTIPIPTGSDLDPITDSIAQLLQPYIRPNVLFLDICQLLVHRGLDPIILKNAVARAGANLAELIRLFFEIEKMQIGSNTYDKGWIDQVRALSCLSLDSSGS